MNDYNASSIRVLTQTEVVAKFEWANVGFLAEKYPLANIVFIRRGIEACRRCSVDPSYFIQRYLDKDTTIAINRDVEAAYRELLNES